MPGPTFWGFCSVSDIMFAFALPGAVPVVGGSSDPSVLRSPGASPQKSRAAHGPLHPAVIIPPRLCLIGEWLCCSEFLGYMFGLFVRHSWSLGSKCCLVWCPLRPAPCSH